MNYIIFGAGETGKRALYFLGYHRVEYFASNAPEGYAEGKKVLSYREMTEQDENQYIIVVASRRYAVEMVEQLKRDQVKNFFVFHESDVEDARQFYPSYMLHRQNITVTYTEILMKYRIERYKSIAVYGDNYFLPYLLAEICIQNDIRNVRGVVCTSGNANIYSFGIACVKLEEVWNDIDCLIVNKRRDESPIHMLLEERAHAFDVADIYDVEKFEESFRHPDLIRYKNIHAGERCFVLGNGPSLTIADLNKLHENHAFCFACNKIYKVFNRTDWRPDVLGMSDPLTIIGSKNDVEELADMLVVMSDEFNRSCDNRFPNVVYYHYFTEIFYPYNPRFSDDMTKGFYLGGSVVYNIGLQMAAYMGFSEIYLLGVDHSYSGNVTDTRNHFIEDYYDDSERELRQHSKGRYKQEAITNAYLSAEKYSRAHGFRIFNATRGGELEVFERVDFDSLF